MPATAAPHYDDILAAVLVGGRGRRLGGIDKARLRRGDQTYLERLVAQLTDVVADIILVGRRDQAYPEVECRLVADQHPGAGPLAGLEAALADAVQPWVFLLACDMPEFDARVLDYLAGARDGPARAIVPLSRNRLQPTCALYHQTVLPEVRRRLASGDNALHALLGSVPHRTLVLPVRLQRAVHNVNRPADLADPQRVS